MSVVIEAPTYEDVVSQTRQPHTGITTLLGISAEEVTTLYQAMTDTEKAEFERILRNMPPKNLMRHQVVPDSFSKGRWWETFLLIGGRGTAKTTTGAFEARKHLRHWGRKARIGAGGPTSADARDVMAEGETGLITMFPNEFVKYNRSLGEARHIGGGLVKFMGKEKPGRWNGPQWSMLWWDEMALCNRQAIDEARPGLRLKGPNGEDPYEIGTTTPKAKKWLKELAQEKTTYVPQYIDKETGKWRLPTTFDNPYLPQRRVDWLSNKYLGSRMGRQELMGEFIDDVAGAQWQRDWIIYEHDPAKWPQMREVVVAVDPAGSVNRKMADLNSMTEEDRQNQRKNADTGLAVVGLGVNNIIYVMALRSGQWTPQQWGAEALRLFYMFRATRIVAETNYGGLMVESNIRNIDVWDSILKRQLKGAYVPIKLVTASQGKHIRSQPVATLYEQNMYGPRIIHCTMFAAGEDQMCSFVDAEENEGADMVDALTWGVMEITGMAEQQGHSIIIAPGDGRVGNFIQVVGSLQGGNDRVIT